MSLREKASNKAKVYLSLVCLRNLLEASFLKFCKTIHHQMSSPQALLPSNRVRLDMSVAIQSRALKLLSKSSKTSWSEILTAHLSSLRVLNCFKTSQTRSLFSSTRSLLVWSGTSRGTQKFLNATWSRICRKYWLILTHFWLKICMSPWKPSIWSTRLLWKHQTLLESTWKVWSLSSWETNFCKSRSERHMHTCAIVELKESNREKISSRRFAVYTHTVSLRRRPALSIILELSTLHLCSWSLANTKRQANLKLQSMLAAWQT